MTEIVQSFTAMINELSTPTHGKQMDFSIPIDDLHISIFQPRKHIKDEELNSLAQSIEQNGLINPITVRDSKENGKFEIIAGERRYRAAILLGWKAIPAILKDLDDRAAHAVALVENLQREDLNPIEEASGYKDLLEQHQLTHDQVAESVGKPRSTISNFIRLLDLDEPVKELLKDRQINVGHAKLLVSLSKEVQGDLADRVVKKVLSVRQLEILIKRTVFSPSVSKPKPPVDVKFDDIAVFLKRKLGEDFEVSVSNSTTNKISFASEESLAKFMELLT